jgi:hypothetical protein
MAELTVDGLGELTSPAANDEIGIWDVSAGQFLKIQRSTLVGATITGGGTIALGGYTLTAPATGTVALRGADNAFSVAQTMAAGINVGVAASALTRPTGGVVRQAIESNVVANDGALVVSTFNTAIVFINDATDGAVAIVSVAGGAGTLIAGSSSIFTGTAGTASRLNVYYLAGTGIVIQNKRGSSITLSAIVMF